MILLGDIALTGLFVQDASKNKQRLRQIIPFFRRQELIFANLECPIFVPHHQNEYKNKVHTSSKEATQQILQLLNISCVSLANNHIYDCKMPGLKATIEALDEIGVKYTGAGWKNEHIEPIILEENNKKIAFLAYVDKSTNPKTENFQELLINYYEVNKVLEDIKKVKPIADTIIISIHWGVDYSHYPTMLQREEATLLIDAGVNIIMGHHPHVMQPYENYKNGLIFYSLGSLTFGDYVKKNGKLGALFRKTKKGTITEINQNQNAFMPVFQGTIDTPGNFIIKTNFSFHNWSRKKWKYYQWGLKYSYYKSWLKFKETFIDRVYEYFFGYYQNPLKRMFQINNFHKVKRLYDQFRKA